MRRSSRWGPRGRSFSSRPWTSTDRRSSSGSTWWRETLVPPAMLQLALLFPHPHKWARWRFLGYVPSLVILVVYELFLYRPAVYSALLQVNMASLGLGSLALAGRLVSEYGRSRSALERQRVRLVTLGVLCGVAFPGALVLSSAISSGRLCGQRRNVDVRPVSARRRLCHRQARSLRDRRHGEAGRLLSLADGRRRRHLRGRHHRSSTARCQAPSPARRRSRCSSPSPCLLLFDPLRTFLQGVRRPRVLPHQLRRCAGAGGGRRGAGIGAHAGAHRASGARTALQGAIPNARTRLFVGTCARGLEEVGGVFTVPRILVPVPHARPRAHRLRLGGELSRRGDRASGCATRSAPSRPRSRCRSGAAASWSAC